MDYVYFAQCYLLLKSIMEFALAYSVKIFRLTCGYNLVGMNTHEKLMLRGRKQVSLPSKRLYGNITLEVYDAYLLLAKC